MKLLLNPYPYQQEGIEFAFANRYSLNGDAMGLGKTVQALGLACRISSLVPGRFLIICPAFLIPNWQSEVEKFVGLEEFRRFNIVSYDLVQKIEDFSDYALVVCDEVHHVKNLQAHRTRKVHDILSQYRPSYFLGLSGTPIKNRVPEFYSPLKLVWRGGYYPQFDVFSKSPHSFSQVFTNRKLLQLGSRKIVKYDGVKNAERLKELIRPIYIRRRAGEVLDLPKQIRQEVLLSDKANTDALLASAWEAYLGKKASKSFSSGKAVSALAKVPHTVTLAREILETTDRVIIFTDHVQAARKICGEFDPRLAGLAIGETAPFQRSELVNRMNSGDLQVLVATIGSLSMGVNITSCNYMIFNDPPWVPADLDQAEARIHRIGQKETCFYYYVLGSKYDREIFRTLDRKRKLIAKVGM
jgi:SNF2 family DNA or RNA helicase